MMSKERDTNNADSDVTEEKIRRLPAGGESWDKKMKRKRSVGAVSSRPIDGEGEPKRTAHHKSSGETGLQSSDPQSYRYFVIFIKTLEFKCLHLESSLFPHLNWICYWFPTPTPLLKIKKKKKMV